MREVTYQLDLLEKPVQECASDIWDIIGAGRKDLMESTWRQTIRSIQNLEWSHNIEISFDNKTAELNEKIDI